MCHISVILMGRSCSVGRWVFYWLSLRVGALDGLYILYLIFYHTQRNGPRQF
jgi:hypothetical protein